MNISRLSTLSLTIAIAVMTLGYANPAFADKPKNDMHDHGDDDGGDVAEYVVTISGDMTGASDFKWREDFGGKKTIGLNDAAGGRIPGEFTDLSFFGALPAAPPTPPFTAGDGANCFSSASFTIHQGSVSKGRGGRAQAGFFFHGLTNDGSVMVLYGLQLIGEFALGAEVEWPPSDGGDTVLNIATWELSATNEGKDIKSISCIGEGATNNVTITVTGPL